MIDGLIFAAAVASGVAVWRLVLLVAMIRAPLLVGVAAGLLLWRARPRIGVDAAVFCDAVSAELRAGATVPAALAAAAESVGADEVLTAVAGNQPRASLAAAVAARFPEVGDELREVLSRGDGLGVAPSVLFDEIATLALARREVVSEVAAATAPARATAAVLLGAPLVATAWVVGGGQMATYLAHPVQRLAVLTGLGLVLAGTALSVVVARRR